MGKIKVALRNSLKKKIEATVYVVKNSKESLLGKNDGEALGVISINLDGVANGENTKVARLSVLKKPELVQDGVVSGGETQEQIDRNLSKMLDEYPELFRGIGKVKTEPIHVHTVEGRKPVAQKLRPVALHLMEPLKKHLEELKEEGVIEGPLGSEHATGWVSNMVIEAKKWDPSKIRVTLDTRLMGDSILKTHFPMPTPEQLRQ